MALAIQELVGDLTPAVMDVVLSGRQLAGIRERADAVGTAAVDERLRCFAGIGLDDAPDRLSARQASSFLLLLDTLYPR